MSNPAILTCALTGVLTDPARHPVPVTPEEMAAEARRATDAGASVLHLHFRQQQPGRGHLPSWDPDVAAAITDAVRDACPAALINQTTGVIGPDLSGPIACLARTRPEIAACNAGSLNYLKVTRDGQWAWPPMLFDNSVSKVEAMLEAMASSGSRPEMECFDLGIVRTVGLFEDVGLLARAGIRGVAHYNFVMGVASGMPADPDLLPLLLRHGRAAENPNARRWQATVIGRADVWAVHQRAAALGGHLRTGLEDTFYLPDGRRATSNGTLIDALAACARDAGRSIAGADEARTLLDIPRS